ncbi:hypothetical protein EW026_g3398 [Hermanssonia centrifuga]|uniref:Uncharacterized protein n=1 Tax=Hermanssonia centrifuga TaxID=98765 RepID=A0A4S4KPX6_9APHY|nr:hypothetical protein EW026_g3398 [Hermanssonia centrifuga]
MSSKRKRTDLDDSDEEEPALGKQVLPVANLPADFNGVPEDGLQYLFTVRRDARLMPHVTRAENPYEIEDKPHEDLLTLSITNDVLPSEKWRDTFLKRFKNFRKNCVQPTIHITNNPPRSTLKVIPDRKDREAWWAYLTGRPESEWNPPKKVKGQNARNQGYGRGMRAYSLETQINLYQETQGAGPSREDVHMNEEREVEQVVAMDPTESLPTPSGTPAPPDRHPGTSASEQVFGEETNLMNITQPEPTPVIMRHMDHVCSPSRFVKYWD